MSNPKVARTLAYLAGFLGAASAALMAGQITGHIPIGLALYATMGAVTATMIWLAMWTVDKVQAHVQQVELLARRHEEAPTGEIKAGTPTFRSTPVAVAVTIPVPRVSEVETFQRRPTLSSLPAALIGQIFRLGVEGEKTRRERP